jgi:hypothetical protein
MFDKKLAIISNYPNSDEIKDGMMQRVANIDDYLLDYDRSYLQISIKNNFKLQKNIIKSDITEYRLHFLKDYFQICKILKKSDVLYVHSLFNFVNLIPFLFIIKKKNIILDFHGVVPEELAFMSKKFKSFVYNIVERIALSYSKHIIFVTKSMDNYIANKHKLNNYKSHILNIFSKNVFRAVNTDELDSLRNKYKINEKDVVFIYSGNTQKWQNIDLMLSCINKIKNVKNYKFIILTGEIEIIKNKLKEFSLLEKDNIIIDTVSPEELGNFYSIAHYGFVLRDEHILNSVANPTKLVEYMWYGIIPIVKFEDLGDYQELGYEFIKYNHIDMNVKKQRSSKNSQIIKTISNKKFDMKLLVNG